MYSIGIDIGTSTITALMCNEKKEILNMVSVKNDSTIIGKSFESLQDPEIIAKYTYTLIETLLEDANKDDCIGLAVSNQMHGIVYVDKSGKAISPFYNWQDKRGDELHISGLSFVEYGVQLTGKRIPSGYGMMTHFYNQYHNLVPNNLYCILDIGMYVLSQLVGSVIDVIHPSNAHAWGCTTPDGEFDISSLEALAIDTHILPAPQESSVSLGTWHGISIYGSMGDNQAGVLGSMGLDAS